MGHRPPQRPTKLDDDNTTTVEAQPRARTPAGRRILGKMGGEDSVSIASPTVKRQGRQVVPQGTASLRAPPASSRRAANAGESLDDVRERVRTDREERRQRVWDKLDAARRHADDRAPRLQSFQPKRAEGATDDDSDEGDDTD